MMGIPEAKDITCSINLYVDDENRVYTMDYIIHSDELMYHSETTMIFPSLSRANCYLTELRKECVLNHVPLEEMIEVV